MVQAHTLVNQRLYRLLVNVSGLDRHLTSLKRLLLMGHGSLFHSFFDKAREAMKVEAGDRYVCEVVSVGWSITVLSAVD